MSNPGCQCNHPIYRRILKEAKPQLIEYFPSKEIVQPDEPTTKNNWTVINCSIQDLQANLKKLGTGRKEVAIARYQDQITIVVNELEPVF